MALAIIAISSPIKLGPRNNGVYLKWLIDWRTASSNSMGPGMSSAGCAACVDIVASWRLGAEAWRGLRVDAKVSVLERGEDEDNEEDKDKYVLGLGVEG